MLKMFGWLLLAVTAATGAAASTTVLQIPVAPVLDTRIPARPIPARLWLPDGAGPFPVIILLHGCGGIGTGVQLEDWSQRVMRWGYAAVIPDSLGPRAVPTVCAPANQPKVTGMDRAGDVINTALFLRTLPQIDGQRIAVIGFSHGGGTAVAVTRQAFERLQPGLIKASVDYYGPCREPTSHGRVPLLALAGDADDWGNPAKTCAAFGQVMRPDQPFELATYRDAVHAFDNAALMVQRINEGHKLLYDRSAAEDSFGRVRTFLDRWVRK